MDYFTPSQNLFKGRCSWFLFCYLILLLSYSQQILLFENIKWTKHTFFIFTPKYIRVLTMKTVLLRYIYSICMIVLWSWWYFALRCSCTCILLRYSLNSPWLQAGPFHPPAQLHVNDPSLLVHCPPFSHGLVLHSLISVKVSKALKNRERVFFFLTKLNKTIYGYISFW